MTKVFESEIGEALRRLSPGYVHKCPDIPNGPKDKVDFLGVYRAVGYGIEAKEERNKDSVTTSIITPNQRSCLESIYSAGGFSAVVINFDRIRGVEGRVGFCFAWIFPDIEWGGRLSIHDKGAHLIPRVSGGWAFDVWMKGVM